MNQKSFLICIFYISQKDKYKTEYDLLDVRQKVNHILCDDGKHTNHQHPNMSQSTPNYFS